MRHISLPWSIFVIGNLWMVHSNNGQENDNFSEELYLKPLPNGDLLAYFSFDVRSSSKTEHFTRDDYTLGLKHFDLMPKVVGEFLTDHALEGKLLWPLIVTTIVN